MQQQLPKDINTYTSLNIKQSIRHMKTLIFNYIIFKVFSRNIALFMEIFLEQIVYGKTS